MNNNTRIKLGCYGGNLSMAVVSTLSPILFLSFREMYGISYSLLGLLVLINFFTQLSVDLLFSFFSHKINIHMSLRTMPVLTIVGLLLYALSPVLFPGNVYIGLALGTVIFSASAGLGEVLISPVIAALPSDDPEREMSKLHSVYAWGVVFVAIFSTVFLSLFGREHWPWLISAFLLAPLMSVIFFTTSKLPEMKTAEKVSSVLSYFKKPRLWLCVFAIFCGGAAECCMGQWCSGYLEMSLSIPKVWGDIFGVAFFSAMLGLGRSLYGKYGRNIHGFLFAGALGAAVCYLTCALSGNAILGLVACALTGFCVSMLWPGMLIVAPEVFPTGGVFIYALMAAGGDSGVAISSQIIGVVTDAVMVNESAIRLAETLGVTAEQIAMRAGMLTAAVFPLVGTVLFAVIWRMHRKGTLTSSANA
ncbi:MAG: MFS transporter [Clostridia bacterium]|nr:MFS transporter [Clostridia bacterium]